MVSKTLRIRIARFGRHLLLAGAGAMSMTSPAWADRAWSWLPLKPDAPASADGAAFETLFYSRTASFDGLARLTEPFQPVPGDAAKGEIASGTLLYRVRTEKETYYCSAKRLRKMTEGDKWSGVWRAPLWQFGLASISPGDTMPQCFQDADGDGRFDMQATADDLVGLVTPAMRVNVVGKLPVNLSYDVIDPATTDDPVRFGLKGVVRDAEKGRFRVTPCIEAKKTEFSNEINYCFPDADQDFSSKDLPAKIKYLDGEITITSLAPSGAGGWTVRYEVSKPAATRALLTTTMISRYAQLSYRLRYETPK